MEGVEGEEERWRGDEESCSLIVWIGCGSHMFLFPHSICEISKVLHYPLETIYYLFS